jgi:hypothetical protein
MSQISRMGEPGYEVSPQPISRLDSRGGQLVQQNGQTVSIVMASGSENSRANPGPASLESTTTRRMRNGEAKHDMHDSRQHYNLKPRTSCHRDAASITRLQSNVEMR